MKVVIISGPTATGKTDMAIELALSFGGEIVNFDSLVLYQEINIGTAKPSSEELKKVPHHMVGIRSIKDPMNAADYSSIAHPLIEKLLKEKKIVYLVGGSGFYLQALIKGMYESPTTPPEVTKKSNELYSREGIGPFLEILKHNDPQSFGRYHENDHYRVRRAVEHWWSHGTPLSKVREEKDDLNQKLGTPTIHDWEILHLYLDIPKEEHLKIIEKRTDRMLAEGLIEEVKALLNSGFSGLEKPLQSIGYKEVLDLQFGVLKSISECRERILISTRQLAKSQRTWFNRDSTKLGFHPLLQKADIFKTVKEFLNK